MYKPYMVVEKSNRDLVRQNYYFATEEEALSCIKMLQMMNAFGSAHYAPVIQVYQDDGFKNV